MADVDRLANGKKVGTVAMLLTALALVASLFFAFVYTAAVPRFYADRMVYDDAARFPLLNPVTYAYEDIDRVCYIEGRWNVYDELVERGSYVLVFADGNAIDLDAGIPVKATEKHVLPLLESYIDRIDTYPSDWELAAEYGKTPDEFLAMSKGVSENDKRV